jgi:hypothetical protein
VEAHPHPDIGPVRPWLRGECSLGRQGRGQRVRGSFEDREEAVAFGADLGPACVGDRAAEDSTVLAEKIVVALAERLDEASRPLDVREQEGDDAGRERLDAYGSVPPEL